MQNGPMGTLCTFYLFRSMMECVSAVSADYQDKRVCDLEPGAQTLVMLLSCITVTFARLQCCHYLHHSRLSTSSGCTDGRVLAVLGDARLEGRKAHANQAKVGRAARTGGRDR